MMKIIIFTALLSAATYGLGMLTDQIPGMDNTAVKIGVGFASLCIAIFIVVSLGFHV